MRHHFIIAEFFDAYDELTPTHVNDRLDFLYANITSLGNLKWVGGWLDIEGTNVTSLGNLEYVIAHLNIRKTKINSLGNLRNVKSIFCSVGEQYDKIKAENEGRFGIRGV